METFCQRIVIFAFTLHFRVDAATQASRGQVRGAGQSRTRNSTQERRLRLSTATATATETATLHSRLAFCAHKIDLNFYCDKKLFGK